MTVMPGVQMFAVVSLLSTVAMFAQDGVNSGVRKCPSIGLRR